MNGYSCLVKGLLMHLMFSSSRCIVLSLNLFCLFMCIFSSSSEVYIRAPSKGRPFTIREVKASNIGQLVKISGIVTRCSDVKPLMQVAVYTCEECGFEIYQVINKQSCLVWFINYVLCCVNDTFFAFKVFFFHHYLLSLLEMNILFNLIDKKFVDGSVCWFVLLFISFDNIMFLKFFCCLLFFCSIDSSVLLCIEQEVTARVFMPLFECPTKRCKTNNTKGNLILQLRASKFLKFQEVTILIFSHKQCINGKPNLSAWL